MKFRDRAGDGPEPDDGLEARLTADSEAWLAETAPSFTEAPAALLPGAPRAVVTPQASLALVPHQGQDDSEDEPAVAGPTRQKWSRRAPLLVAAAVIALVAAVAIPLWANRSHTAAPTPGRDDVGLTTVPVVPAQQCPEADGRPPADVGSIVPATGSLVPAEAPVSMLICEYPLPSQPDPAGARPSMGATFDIDYQDLRHSRTITAGLESVPEDLSRFTLSAEPGCEYFTTSSSGMSAPSGSEFLVALNYPTGTVWIADSTGPNTCLVATSSRATSTGSYSDLFLRSLGSGTWQPGDRSSVECPLQVDATPYAGSDPLPKPAVDTDGRLVPTDQPASVVLCGYLQVEPDVQPKAEDVPGSDLPLAFIAQRFELQGNYAPLVSELRAASPADPSTMRCPKPTDAPTPQLIGLTYGEGAQRQTVWIDARIGATCGLAANGAIWASGDIAESVRSAMAKKTWAGMTVVDLTADAPGPMPSAPQTSPGPELTTSAGIASADVSSGTAPSSLSPQNEACVNPRFVGEGLEQTMIPAGYRSVFNCVDGAVRMPAGLVDKINGLSEPVDASGCPGGDSLELVQGAPFLVFLYDDRPPVLLNFVDSCAPTVGNGVRDVAAPEDVLDQLRELAGY